MNGWPAPRSRSGIAGIVRKFAVERVVRRVGKGRPVQHVVVVRRLFDLPPQRIGAGGKLRGEGRGLRGERRCAVGGLRQLRRWAGTPAWTARHTQFKESNAGG